MVFQTLPGFSVVRPMTSWQVSTRPGMMYWRRVRTLACSGVPSSITLASASRTSTVSWRAWAGVETR